MSTVQEIERAIPKLSRQELDDLKAWFDDSYEDGLELTDEVKTSLDQARAAIAAGQFRTRQPR
jgi:exonuclease VII small subunit